MARTRTTTAAADNIGEASRVGSGGGSTRRRSARILAASKESEASKTVPVASSPSSTAGRGRARRRSTEEEECSGGGVRRSNKSSSSRTDGDAAAGTRASATSDRKVAKRRTAVKPRKKAKKGEEDDDMGIDNGGGASAPPPAITTAGGEQERKKKRCRTGIELCLPRTRELQLLRQHDADATASASPLSPSSLLHVMGVDEAGRGPLAGPVVAAAAIVPTNVAGVTDSKRITNESDREDLYEKITSSPGVRWAAAIVDAGRIDDINILQATLEGMRKAAETVVYPPASKNGLEGDEDNVASSDRVGCYVVCGRNDHDNGNGLSNEASNTKDTEATTKTTPLYHALIDGNRVPTDMPCPSEAMVKGDSREFCIGAASIIAKVTRDRIMRGYARMYPEYDLQQNKGYPTAAHMAAVRQYGASPIHRRTFAPLKHMDLDEDGRIV